MVAAVTPALALSRRGPVEGEGDSLLGNMQGEASRG